MLSAEQMSVLNKAFFLTQTLAQAGPS